MKIGEIFFKLGEIRGPQF